MRLPLSSIQWYIFILAGSVVAPLAIGSAFQLSQPEIAGLLQRTLFVIGLSSLLQVWLGHKLPIAEGPAGLWWGVFLIFAGLASTMGQGSIEILQSIELGLLVSGVFFIIISLLKLIHVIKQIFTPIVTGTYLILLVAQLSGSFAKGILGIGYLGPEISVKVVLPALLTLIVSIVLAKSPYPLLSSYSVLFGLAFGWILFAMLDLIKPIPYEVTPWFSLPTLLAWGAPKLDTGTILTSIITALLLLTNLIASIHVVEKAVERPPQPIYNRSGLIMGVNQMLAGLFSAIGSVPLSITAGFIHTTKMKEKLPFIIGSGLILGMSFFPIITMFFASLPIPVGYATLFLSFSNMIGIGLKEYASVGTGERNLFIIGISLMVGIGSLFIPTESLLHLPRFLAPLMNNGLVLGVITCILLEQGIRLKDRLRDASVYAEGD
jgi:xanthine/uracil permease